MTIILQGSVSEPNKKRDRLTIRGHVVNCFDYRTEENYKQDQLGPAVLFLVLVIDL